MKKLTNLCTVDTLAPCQLYAFVGLLLFYVDTGALYIFNEGNGTIET